MDRYSNGELSGKYCSRLGSNVMILSSKDKNGKVDSRCLSSHLCQADHRIECGLGRESAANTNINMQNFSYKEV